MNEELQLNITLYELLELQKVLITYLYNDQGNKDARVAHALRICDAVLERYEEPRV